MMVQVSQEGPRLTSIPEKEFDPPRCTGEHRALTRDGDG